MFGIKRKLCQLLNLMQPRYKRQLNEIRREIWVHKDIYLNEMETVKTAISLLHHQEVVRRNGGVNK